MLKDSNELYRRGVSDLCTSDGKVRVAKASLSHPFYYAVKAPAEGVLDSRVLVGVGEMGRTMAQSLRANTATIDMDEFMNKIALYVGGGGAKMGASTQAGGSRRKGRRARGEDEESDEDELDAADDWNWDKLGRLATKFSRRVPTVDSL